MSKNPFDQFCKQILESFLSPFGTVNISREVPGESRLIDVWFEPSGSLSLPEHYGLLKQIAATACLIEPFRKQPSMIEVYSCKEKLFAIFGELQRQAVRDKRSIPDSCEELPWLWILASSASDNLVLNRLELTPDTQLRCTHKSFNSSNPWRSAPQPPILGESGLKESESKSPRIGGFRGPKRWQRSQFGLVCTP
jgi:hypothetical protein